MKILPSLRTIKKNYPIYFLFGSSFYLFSCATHHAQYGKNLKENKIAPVDGKKIQSFYLIGDAGELILDKNKSNFEILKSDLQKADSASYLMFLGDNIYPNGLNPEDGSEENLNGKAKLDIQIELAKNFKGKSLFVPGNHDWYNGLEGVKAQEKYIKKAIDQKKVFLPKDGCGIDKIKVNDSIGIIALDSQWYLEDWDKNPSINEKCDIKTRESFFEEFESQLNKFQNRTTLVVVHHPLATNGSHGGKFSLKQQLFPFENVPLPVIGSVLNLVRATSGLSPQDLQNSSYRDFASRISTLVQDRENVVVVSGHDHNLQYIQENNLRQIISGSASKEMPAKTSGKNDFSYGGKGYAVLNVFDNGASEVNFYAFEGNKSDLLLTKEVTPPKKVYKDPGYQNPQEGIVKSTVYDPSVTKKSDVYKFFFGRHYRSTYGKEISVKSANLDKLYGGLTPSRMGGGHQTNSLRLVDNQNREYNMRAVKKSATRFIQSVAFKNEYVVDEFENTFTEKFLMDFYTTSHPFYPMTIPSMQKALNIYHAQPQLYYIPKQTGLKEYNEFFGDELYMIEERPTVEHQDFDRFGSPKDIIATDEMLANIQKNPQTKVDKEMYMRVRLFDMLIGDWDRHEDQWRWAEFEENGYTIYRPIPRDRDQIFPRYDGTFFKIIMGIPPLRHMQDYKDDIKSVKWFNREPYPLDLAILEASDLDDWEKQAKYIQDNLTEKTIKKSFEVLPNEVKNNYDNVIIERLLERKEKLNSFAKEYHKVLSKIVILKGTNERDNFVITRLPKGKTSIKVYAGEQQELVMDRVFEKKLTKEIRLYGLNETDTFSVDGKGTNPIKIRLIGGIDDDIYEVKRNKNIRIYDYKNGNSTEASSFLTSKKLIDDYEINTYDHKMPKYNVFTMLPNAGYNPDDGIMLGLSPTFTINGFDRKPYSSRHNLKLNYFFATQGFEAKYKGTFIKAIGKWNLDINGRYTSPTFSTNFFGLGNETVNNQEELGMDFNRTRQESYEVGPSFYKIFRNQGRLDFFANYKYIKVEENLDRIVANSPDVNREVFRGQNFTEIGANYIFRNYNNESLPTLGMTFLAHAKWITNNETLDNNFVFSEVNLGFTHKLSANGKLTLASMIKGKAIFGNGYEFYQGAILGGDQDLRGYRLGRFIGDKVFLQSTDLRLDLLKLKAGIPMRLGVFTGFDYGRVWLKDENSDKWHDSYGGGIWLNGAQMITATVSYFKGTDPGRIVFGLNFGF